MHGKKGNGMTIQGKSGDDCKPSDECKTEVSGAGIPRNPSRRRFAGAAASGVLLTLTGRSAMASTTGQSPSGFYSGNVSGQGQLGGLGRSPGYWKNHPSAWPHSPSAKFQHIFIHCSTGSPYYNKSLIELLDPLQADRHNLAMHLIASYLNARAEMTPYLTTEKVIQIFNEWQSRGYFSPVPGARWDAEQIVIYLQSTHI